LLWGSENVNGVCAVDDYMLMPMAFKRTGRGQLSMPALVSKRVPLMAAATTITHSRGSLPRAAGV
jgi:hypothetical protein